MNKLSALLIAGATTVTVSSGYAQSELLMKDYDDEAARNVVTVVEPASLSTNQVTLRAVREAASQRLPASKHVLRSNLLRLKLDFDKLKELGKTATADDLFDVILFEDVVCRVRTVSVDRYSDSSLSWSGACAPNWLDRFHAKAAIRGDRVWWSGSLRKDGQAYIFDSLPDIDGFGVAYQLSLDAQIREAVGRDKSHSDMFFSERAIKWKEEQESKAVEDQ